MAVSINHLFTSPIADGTNTNQIAERDGKGNIVKTTHTEKDA